MPGDQFDRDDLIRGINAQLHPEQPILQAAAEVTAAEVWPYDWLNSNATMFLPFLPRYGANPECKVLHVHENITVEIVSPRTLFAMKVNISRAYLPSPGDFRTRYPNGSCDRRQPLPLVCHPSHGNARREPGCSSCARPISVTDWSSFNLRHSPNGQRSLQQFRPQLLQNVPQKFNY